MISINFAIAQLGARAVIAMALSTVIYRAFDNSNGVVDHMKMWRHSLETAVICRELALRCGYHLIEEAFLLGLMHDIGLIVMEAQFPSEYIKIWDRVHQGGVLIEIEQEVLGTNHARVGKFLLDLWKLPPFMGEAVGKHHDEFQQVDREDDTILERIVNLGNRISKFPLYKLSKEELRDMRKISEFSDSLGLSSLDMVHLQSNTLEQVDEESQFLEMNTGSTSELLEQANLMLYEQFMEVDAILKEQLKISGDLTIETNKGKALESFKTVTGAINYYLSMTTTSLMGGAQVLRRAISNGRVIDKEEIVANYTTLVMESMETVARFQAELKHLTGFNDQQLGDQSTVKSVEDRLNTMIESTMEE